MAVSKQVFAKEFSTDDIEEICIEFKLDILVFDIENESIEKWIKK